MLTKSHNIVNNKRFQNLKIYVHKALMLQTAMGFVFFSLFILFLFNKDFAHQSVNRPELAQWLIFICCPVTDFKKAT